MEKLSLIDVSSEDDLLISSPADCRRDPRSSGIAENHNEHTCFVLEPTSAHERENLLKMSQQWVHVPETSEPPEQKRGKSGNVNLRKSLAWDSAFFTSEGVLNSEELAIVNSTFRKTAACSLPGIQEELRRSSESTSTLDSESYTLESLEGDLFENVRASIQKSLGNRGNCTSGVTIAPCRGARKLVGITAQTKAKKRSGDSKIPVKPPRIVPKPTTLPCVPSTNDLSGSLHLNPSIRRTSSGSDDNQPRIVAFSKTNGDSSDTISRSIPSLKPDPGSHQGTAACSTHVPLEPTRKRSAGDQSLPGSTTKTTVRVLKSKLNQRANTTFKFPSRASPSSSTDSIVSEPPSSTSSPRSSEDQPCIRREISANLLQGRSVAKPSAGTRLSSEPSNRGHARNSINSVAPSGLRMPSPKIGYFDAEKTKTLVIASNKISQAGTMNGSSDTVGGNMPKSSKIPSMRLAVRNVAQSASSSPLSMRPQSQPSQDNKNPSPVASRLLCKGADNNENLAKGLQSVPIKSQKENLFPAHETKVMIQGSYRRISPVGAMDKEMALLSLSEAADLVD